MICETSFLSAKKMLWKKKSFWLLNERQNMANPSPSTVGGFSHLCVAGEAEEMPVWAQLVPQPASERWLRPARRDPQDFHNYLKPTRMTLRDPKTRNTSREQLPKHKTQGEFFLFQNRFGFAIHKKNWWVSEWNLWGKHCEMCVSHEATPEQPERVREQRLGLMEICGWRSEANVDGIDAGLKYWIKLNQVERIKQNQTPSIMFDPTLRIRCHILLQGKWIHGANGNASCPSDYMRCLESFQTSNPYGTLKTSKKWRDHIKQMISDKTASILHCFIRFWCSSLPLHPWLHVAVLLPSPVLRLVRFTSISGPSP